MKTTLLFVAALLSTLLVTPKAHCAQAVPAEAFSTPARSFVSEGDPLAANATDSGLYSDGTRAIHESRWSDAVTIFTKVASEQGEHSDGALYWKAYAENKQEHASAALDTCLELRRDHPKSRWIEECGALEIEIRAKSGQPIQPQAEQDDDLKLLALNSRMKQDELHTVPEIQQILNGDLSETFKERALFVLAQGQSKQAQELLGQIAHRNSNAALQAKAAEMIASRHGNETASPSAATNSANRAITFDVVVTDNSGKPVAGLQPQDFTLFDNKEPRNVISFHGADDVTAKDDAPVEAILVVDRIRSEERSMANTRIELLKYLRENGGRFSISLSAD